MPSDIECKTIAIERLHAHPANPNVVPADLLRKLKGHIERTGRYPPIIVRPLAEDYQILDGHHRVAVLSELGHTSARCDVWPVDDDEALLLIGTLNRLCGSDDVLKRARLIADLQERFGADRLATLLPESRAQIEKLASLTLPPPAVAESPTLGDMPGSLTFFLTETQRRGVIEKLKSLHEDRSKALLIALQLGDLIEENGDGSHC